MRIKFLIIISAVLVLPWCYAVALADLVPGTYYVDSDDLNANDNNPGTSSQLPWKTLHHAITQLNGGTSGTYVLKLGTRTSYRLANGELNANIILSQSNVTVEGTQTTIVGTGLLNWTTGIEITGSNVTLKGLWITGFSGTYEIGIKSVTGSGNTVENCKVYGNYDAIRVFQSNDCIIKTSEIYENTSDGISIEDSTGGLITENTVHDNVGTNSDGIKIDGCDPEVSRNKLYDNRFNISINAASPTIKNNLIYEATPGAVSYGITIGGTGTVSPKIYHNTIDGGEYVGIHIADSGNAPEIKYNIITGFDAYTSSAGIQNFNSLGNPVIDYNNVWHNGSESPFENNYVGCSPGLNYISVNPQYGGNGDYTLQGTSPCINAIPTGDPPNDPVTNDIDGTDRPYGSGYDMGCYEDTTLAAVTTSAVSSITTTTATGNGNIGNLGETNPTSHGVCWNTSGTPTISDNIKDIGAASATGDFTASMTDLAAGTTYYVRAFATNGEGTSYGSVVSFATNSPAITSFSPSRGGANTSVVITGTNFTEATEVKFGGTNATSFTVNSSTQITAIVASGSTGKVTVTVPGNTATSSGDFTYAAVIAGTYYVNSDNAIGSDSNAGTADAPWKTLHHAISQINGGGSGSYTLNVAAGTYSISNGESAATLIVSQSNVAIIGPDHHTIGAGTAIIDGTGTSINDWIYGINPTGSNITIKDISIKNFSAAGQYGIYMSASTETEVINCKISNNHTGVELAAGSNNFNIRFCEIYENTTDGLNVLSSTGGEIYRNTIYRHQGAGDDGVAVFGCSPAIKRNKIYDNDTGIRVEANSTASPNISNNIIYETTDYTMNHGILVTCLAGGTASPTICHNTIDGGSGDGIEIDWQGNSGDVAAPVIKYNIITRCDGTGSFGINANAGATCAPNYNDVWGNATNYSDECNPGNEEIDADPKNGPPEFKLPSDSPCINTIPATDPPGDPVTIDYHGYSRPGGTTSTSKDMGACEYIATRTDSYTLPGGSGLETDYDIFTVPLYIGTGQDMRNTMESALGSYDPTRWRVFALTTSGDIEMNTSAFASLDIKPGMGFWGITVLTDVISFQGTLAPDAIYYHMELAPGWHLIAVPWPNTSIQLGKIYVTDGVNQYTITDAVNNTLTQKYIWDYTGTGPSSGYVERTSTDFSLADGIGYFIKVLGSSNIILSIPPNNSSDPPNNRSTHTPHAMSYESPESVGLTDDPEPPPLPGGSYGPVPSIRANELGDNMTVTNGTPVSITVSLDPGDQVNKNADWWVVAHTPFDSPLDWYSYVHPEGWQPGIHPCLQVPLFQVPPSFEVLNTILPPGDYKFYFAVDENADGIVDETWVDSVDVRVEQGMRGATFL